MARSTYDDDGDFFKVIQGLGWPLIAAWAALTLETHTGPLRENDSVLCQGGMAQMIAGLEQSARTGQAPRQVENGPGMVGKSYEVDTPPDFQVRFASADAWRPEQDRLRATMPARMASLMKLKGPPAPPTP